MLKTEETWNNPAMPKRTTSASTVQIPGALSTQKRMRPLPAVPQTICSALPETPVKNLASQNQSPTRHNGGGRPSHIQNGSAKKGSVDSKVDSLEVEQSSRNGNRRSDNYLVNGDTPEVFSDATNVRAAFLSHQEAKIFPLEAKYADCSDDRIKSSYNQPNEGDMSPPLMPEVVMDDPEGVEPLLPELMDDIIGRLPMVDVIQLRSELGKAFRNAIHRPAFRRSRPEFEGEFSPSFFMTDDEGDMHWHGFDTKLRKWTTLPSLNFAKQILPSPDPDLFKDYLVAGDGGLLCINVGKAPGREKLVICNPLTQEVKVLPSLNYARHPVLMHLKVDHDSEHYNVIVAGSAAIGTEGLSLKTEEYDSRKGVWECPGGSDLPCPAFGLNEYQNGVYFKDLRRELLMCVAIIDTRGRGVLVYDITKKKWVQGPHVKQLHIPLVRSEPNVSHLATTQIVECGGCVYVFSEQECGRDVYFLIHKLIPEGSGNFTWEEVTKRKRTGGRGLLVYPEFTCVPVSEHELCIFDTIEHTIEIIDLTKFPAEVAPLQSAPTSKGNRFHSLNPIGFVFKPSFRNVVCPRGENVSEYCSECERRKSERRNSESLRAGLRMEAGSKLINHVSASMVKPGPKVVTVPSQ